MVGSVTPTLVVTVGALSVLGASCVSVTRDMAASAATCVSTTFIYIQDTVSVTSMRTTSI